MKENFEYEFWFWGHKLSGILYMLAELSKYTLDEFDLETIQQQLTGTNDELNLWTDYEFHGSQFPMTIQFAYDAEENHAMIHVKIKTTIDLKDKLVALNLFQSMFKELEIEK